MTKIEAGDYIRASYYGEVVSVEPRLNDDGVIVRYRMADGAVRWAYSDQCEITPRPVKVEDIVTGKVLLTLPPGTVAIYMRNGRPDPGETRLVGVSDKRPTLYTSMGRADITGALDSEYKIIYLPE